jgi:hypothetical protein
VVNGEMSLRRLKLSIYEVVTPREEEELRVNRVNKLNFTHLHVPSYVLASSITRRFVTAEFVEFYTRSSKKHSE